ncbi:zinc-ribbon domain-containing protein [candidate division KSB1 bacterium]|nr:zinc-ribbon domain-containing protein [candidate division KSB1 bacterium]
MYIGLIITVLMCGYVLYPLFVRKYKGGLSSPDISNKNEAQFIRGILQDLEFDLETGKLDEEEYQKLVTDQNAVLDKLAKEQSDGKANRGPAKCAKCGANLQRSDNFCPKCGAAVF